MLTQAKAIAMPKRMPIEYLDPEWRDERGLDDAALTEIQAEFYRDDPNAPCEPEPWEQEYQHEAVAA